MAHYDIYADASFHDQNADSAHSFKNAFSILRQMASTLLRVVLFGISSLLQRPLASLVMTLCLWGMANASLGLVHQTRHHPAPMFQNKAVLKSETKTSATDEAPAAASSLPTKQKKPVFAVQQDVDPILVLTVQNRLRELGYDCGDDEGVIGAKSRAAIAKFEQVAGLPGTGTLSAGFLKKLTAAHKAR